MALMKVRVLLFASLREIAGDSELSVELADGATLASLEADLAERWPAFGQIPFVFAVNRDYATRDRVLVAGDEVALVPAISGGEQPRFDVAFTREVIDPRVLESIARRDHDGAIVTFLGVTRDHHAGQPVARLSYEAFEAMAVDQLMRILKEIAEPLELGRVLVRHRLGEVPVGEASIAVVCSGPHRADVFTAVRQIMDRIKAEVPIFKKEFFAGSDEPRWVGELPGVQTGEDRGENEKNAGAPSQPG